MVKPEVKIMELYIAFVHAQKKQSGSSQFHQKKIVISSCLLQVFPNYVQLFDENCHE